MTAPLTLLIVEDETPLAEMHANIFVTFPDSVRYYWRENLAQARMMIERFKPGLILLDNYLPDGRGINLLHELVQAHYPGDVVFTTAASDMENGV
ncbi:two-component response regulator [Escherichia coli]|uniref:Two-component response regulator n=1 Tax=Escherichia coli TaxID=562 RepID=A0A2X1N130_ECOLX|nr:two-component response regulator [Escherichia coli]